MFTQWTHNKGEGGFVAEEAACAEGWEGLQTKETMDRGAWWAAVHGVGKSWT